MLTNAAWSPYYDSPSAVLPEKRFYQSLRKGQVESRRLVAVVEGHGLVNRNEALVTFQRYCQWNPNTAIPHRRQVGVIGQYRW
jgi:hypothetical protein